MTVLKSNTFVRENQHLVNTEFRNEFHAMAPIGWMNDPNGFIYFRGQYHLFFQYYPYDSVWGPMHWGHSVSDDGVKWTELPTALEPDQPYDKDGCFSGTAYVEDDILYLMYTGHVVEGDVVRQVQCLAKSTDGINFEKFEQNPVIHDDHIKDVCLIADFRDPKLLKRDGTYYSIVAAKTADNRGQLLIFESNDMIKWSEAKVLLEGDATQGIMWECPDIFELDGKDVIIMSPIQMKAQGYKYTNISSTVAMIGKLNWDTLKFELETYHEMDSGTDFYAPQSVINDKGERYIVAWMQMWDREIISHTQGHKWAGSMTLPREVRVINNKLVQTPIKGIYDHLNYEKVAVKEVELSEIANNPQYIALRSLNTNFELRLVSDSNEYISLTRVGNLLNLSREHGGHKIVGNEGPDYTSRTLELSTNELDLEIIIDTSSIEVFINKEDTMTMTFYKKLQERKVLVQGLDVETEIKLGYIK